MPPLSSLHHGVMLARDAPPPRRPSLTSGVSRMADSFTLTSMPLLFSSDMGPSFLWDLQTSIGSQASGIRQLINYICSSAGHCFHILYGPCRPTPDAAGSGISASLLPT